MINGDERVFAALADTTRRQLLLALAESSPKTAIQLAQEFPISRQGISKHLNLLAEAGLVLVRPVGREKRYFFRPEPLHAVSAWFEGLGARWEARLRRLKRRVEDGEA